MMEYLLELDKEIFLALNGFHTPWLDPVMLLITETLVWLPLYLFLIYLIFKIYKQDGWMVLMGIVITIVLADQITSSFMKPYFARLRPSREPSLESFIHLVNGYKGGKFGFASSHAANTFGAATFFFLLFGKRFRWIWILFVWASVVTYSRIYLGVHYPGDIMVGAIVGALAGLTGFKFFQWIKKMSDKRKQNLSGSTE
jgi:undecaprenyl-diphosphatase